MPTYEDARKHSDAFTARASDVARHLAFAGIAVIWVFAGGGTEKVENVKIGDFKVALFGFVLALATDYLQYAWQALRIRVFLYKHASELKQERMDYPKSLRPVADGFFFAKLLLVGATYALLAVQIGSKL